MISRRKYMFDNTGPTVSNDTKKYFSIAFFNLFCFSSSNIPPFFIVFDETIPRKWKIDLFPFCNIQRHKYSASLDILEMHNLSRRNKQRDQFCEQPIDEKLIRIFKLDVSGFHFKETGKYTARLFGYAFNYIEENHSGKWDNSDRAASFDVSYIFKTLRESAKPVCLRSPAPIFKY